MRVKVLAEDAHRVVAVVDGDECLAEAFMTQGESSTLASRLGLMTMLQAVAEKGLTGVPSPWFHEASKEHGIYEFIKGPLRLFFFKGKNGDVAVCTGGVRKSGRKADKTSVNAAAVWKDAYMKAVQSNDYEVIRDEDEQEAP